VQADGSYRCFPSNLAAPSASALCRHQRFARLGTRWQPPRVFVIAKRDPEIYVADNSGRNLKRVTTSAGPDVSPSWNPKTGAQIASSADVALAPDLHHGTDGTNPQRMTDQGYAVSPAWSPNGQFLVFSWMRQIRPWRPGRAGYLHYGYCEQAMGAASRTMAGATTSPPGRQMDGTLCSNRRAQEVNSSGRCWPMAATHTSSPPAAAIRSPTGAGSRLMSVWPRTEVYFGGCVKKC